MFALSGDSSFLVDGQAIRWLVFDGARVVQTIDAANPLRAKLRVTIGADATGHVLASQVFSSRRHRATEAGALGYGDSTAILLGARQTGRIDTVARLAVRRSTLVQRTLRVDGVDIIYHLRNLLVADDQALLFSDGWVGVAYSNPYRVDWRTSTGQWVKGEPLKFEAIRADEAERVAAVGRARTVPRSTGPQFTSDDYPNWPATLPPFENDALLASPEGLLVVRRTPSVKVPGIHYDFVDRMGRLRARLSIANNERILGFSAGWVYVVERDADDLERLRRHSWTSPLIGQAGSPK